MRKERDTEQPSIEEKFLTVESWRSYSYILHGFGTRNMTEDDLIALSERKGFVPVSLLQIHSDIIHPLFSAPQSHLKGDAVLTDRPGLLLFVKTADCLPVLIFSERPRAIAAVHCGWRGTALGLVAKATHKMERIFGCPPASLRAAFGPSIGRDCYRVGEDVRNSFDRTGYDSSVFKSDPSRERKYFFDLREANRFQLVSSGVRTENISEVSQCTRCDGQFYSYRRDSLDPGRMLNFIGFFP